MASLGLIALVIVLVTTTHWFLRAFRVDIPDNSTPYAIAWGVGGALGLLSLVFGGGGGAAAWAMGLGFLFLYFVRTAVQRVGDEMISVGDTLPAFTATDDKGEVFDSAELKGTPVLLKFFRGHW